MAEIPGGTFRTSIKSKLARPVTGRAQINAEQAINRAELPLRLNCCKPLDSSGHSPVAPAIRVWQLPPAAPIRELLRVVPSLPSTHGRRSHQQPDSPARTLRAAAEDQSKSQRKEKTALQSVAGRPE
jgi:hypothetical protein